jgi:hypothetical protein
MVAYSNWWKYVKLTQFFSPPSNFYRLWCQEQRQAAGSDSVPRVWLQNSLQDPDKAHGSARGAVISEATSVEVDCANYGKIL